MARTSERAMARAELFVVLLVFGLMWTCGGLSLQSRLHDLRWHVTPMDVSR